jgi:pimeloyl-ACP methyl ester carboxylesterase
MFDTELESFKNGIDLRAYAAEQGYQLDRKESWRGSAVMRHPNGDKIVIKRDWDNHYVYFSVRQDNDSGSIIDFVQHRQRLSLGAVRKELRPYIGLPSSRLPDYPPLPKTSKDRMRVETEYAKMQDASRHPYLENERALPASLLESECFAGRVRIDARGNAVFPHFDQEGLCGYEIKNKGFTGFSSGGTKGLWLCDMASPARRLVVPLRAINGDLYPTDLAGVRRVKPDFEVLIMEHMGHYPMLERPEEFDQHVAEVVRALLH